MSGYENPDTTLIGCECDTSSCLPWLDASGRKPTGMFEPIPSLWEQHEKKGSFKDGKHLRHFCAVKLILKI